MDKDTVEHVTDKALVAHSQGSRSDRGKSHNKETRGPVNPIVYTLALDVELLSKDSHSEVGDTR